MAAYRNDPEGRYEWLGYKRLAEGFFTVDKVRLRHRMSSGGMSEELSWYLLQRPDAVCAIVRNTDRDTLYFVRQFRLGMAVKEDDPWAVELAAGIVDPGETPVEAIRREIDEELGFAVTDVEEVQVIYPSPAILSERIILYYAEVTNAQRHSDGGGSAHEHEDLEIIEVGRADLEGFLRRQRITDAKTLCGVSWFLREKGAV